RLGVLERLPKGRLELRLASRQSGKPSLALVPVAGWCVEQDELQPVGLQPRCNLIDCVFVWKQDLDAFEPCLSRGLEPVEKRDLVEHHCQVGGKARHQAWSPAKTYSLGTSNSHFCARP